MTSIAFSVRFHQPFLVASGYARGGLDAVGIPGSPVPASSLKGAMRHAATHVLGVRADLIDDVFGRSNDDGAPWAWNDLGPETAFVTWSRARNRIDADTGTVHPEALILEEETWQRPEPAGDASFLVEQLHALSQEALKVHRDVLTASAFGVTALGTGRNRSMGTVTIRPVLKVDTADLLRSVGQLQKQEDSHA